MPGRDDVFQKAMSEGHSAAWDQQWDKAAAAYRKALDEIPGHPKALTSLGLALYELQDYPKSLRVYEKATQAAPTDPVPLEKVALLSERLGMIPEAIRSSMKAADLYIKNQDFEKALENWVRVTQLDADHVTARSLTSPWSMNASAMPNRLPPNTWRWPVFSNAPATPRKPPKWSVGRCICCPTARKSAGRKR